MKTDFDNFLDSDMKDKTKKLQHKSVIN